MVELGAEGGAHLEVTVDTGAEDDVLVVLTGELDLSNVDALAALVDPLVASTPDRLIFDLHELAFLDSSGIALLLRAAARAGTVVVRRPSTIVRRVLEATGLTQVLKIEP